MNPARKLWIGAVICSLPFVVGCSIWHELREHRRFQLNRYEKGPTLDPDFGSIQFKNFIPIADSGRSSKDSICAPNPSRTKQVQT